MKTLKPKSLSPSSINLQPITLKSTGSTNVASVVNTEKCNIASTVLSKEFQQEGGVIEFGSTYVHDNWGRLINRLVVPKVKATYEMDNTVAILHPIARRANNLLRVLTAFNAQEQDLPALQKSVKNYYLELCKNLFGKNGVYNRYVLGPRMKNSFRAVIVPGRFTKAPLGDSYEWVGIPMRICNSLGICIGDKVIIGRDPTIWFGSLEVLYAYPVEHDAIEIHPLLLPQLGGDHDGDQVWGMLPTSDMPMESIAQFTKRYACWSKNFVDLNPSPQVDWNKGFSLDFVRDEEARMKTTGLSISPADIVNNDDSLKRVLSYCGKGARARGRAEYKDLVDAYSQLPIQDWLDLTNMINRANLGMKVFMGPVGLVALRLAVLGHNMPSIQEACNLLAERCAQSLLDAKHLTAAQIKVYKPAEIFEIINLKRKDVETADQMFDAITEIINCDKRVIPALEFLIADGRGLSKLSQEEFPLFEGTTWTGESAENGYSPDVLFFDEACVEEGIFSSAFLFALGKGNEKKEERKAIIREFTSANEDSSEVDTEAETTGV